jgi:hypothetical protein
MKLGLLTDIPALQAEWCKARACALRWHEEIVILEEEMRHTIAYSEWRADWWDSRPRPESASAELLDGLDGYAVEHACTEQERSAFLTAKWAPIREKAARVLWD